jgi:hypothetical protein
MVSSSSQATSTFNTLMGCKLRIGRNLSKAIERNGAGDEGHGARENWEGEAPAEPNLSANPEVGRLGKTANGK